MDPLGTSGLEVGEESLVDGEEFGEEADGLEARLSRFCGLAKDKEGDRAEHNRAGGDTECLSFLEFLDSLVEVELEVGLIGELGDDKVVVRVEPGGYQQQLFL